MKHGTQKTGIYGGTFAPPHYGHIAAARNFLAQAGLDHLLIMPTLIPPHKILDFGDDPAVRLSMVRAAFSDVDPRISVSDYEMTRAGVSYTWQTLEHFASVLDDTLYFLCGTDMFLTLGQWKKPEKIFEHAVIACMARKNDSEAYRKIEETRKRYEKDFHAEVLLLRGEPVEVSSTEIRDRVRNGMDVSHLTPDAVAKMIAEHGLYRKQGGKNGTFHE